MPSDTFTVYDDWHYGKLVSWALGVCCLASTQRIVPGKKNPETILDEAFEQTYITLMGKKKPHGNLLFAVTSSQLLGKGGSYNTAYTKHLLEHPNTKIIHWFKNNSHGPNLIFLCIHHRFPEEVERSRMKNNIEKYRLRIYTDEQGEHHLKPE